MLPVPVRQVMQIFVRAQKCVRAFKNHSFFQLCFHELVLSFFVFVKIFFEKTQKTVAGRTQMGARPVSLRSIDNRYKKALAYQRWYASVFC